MVTICDGTGEPAARGQLGLAGDDAVPDHMETMPGHRRRGLGSVVIGTLATEALTRGARTGLLIASPTAGSCTQSSAGVTSPTW